MQAIDTLYPHLNPLTIAQQHYLNSTKNLETPYVQSACYELLGFLNTFCEANETRYFTFASGLQGAIVYNDFIPGDKTLEIGMLRHDYLKFETSYFGNASHLPFSLSAHHDAGKKIRRTMPILTLSEPHEIRLSNGTPLFDRKHYPIYANPEIRISIFDQYPSDADLRKLFFFRIKIANYFSNSVSAARDKSTKIGGKKLYKGLARLLPWRFVNNHAWKLAGKYAEKQCSDVGRLLHSRSKHIPMDDLLPLKQVPFGPASIPCPQNPRTWIEEDLESEMRNVRYLQQDAMQIMKEINRICRKNDIGYFICGGTMLGYVRHKGFIPWDDDMDIGMLRGDYERFLSCAKKQIDDRFFLQTRESDPLIPYLFSKVRMNGSEYITSYNKDRDFHKGICVDIFPFDRIPDDRSEFLSFKAQVDRQSKKHNKVANHQIPTPMKNEPMRSPQAVVARAVGELQRRRFWRIPLSRTQKAYDETVTRNNDRHDYRYVASFVPTFTMVRIDDLLPYQDVEYEGETLMAPAKPEVFLQMQYGDFMTMPMPHQQRGHGLLWWKDLDRDSRDWGDEQDQTTPDDGIFIPLDEDTIQMA